MNDNTYATLEEAKTAGEKELETILKGLLEEVKAYTVKVTKLENADFHVVVKTPDASPMFSWVLNRSAVSCFSTKAKVMVAANRGGLFRYYFDAHGIYGDDAAGNTVFGDSFDGFKINNDFHYLPYGLGHRIINEILEAEKPSLQSLDFDEIENALTEALTFRVGLNLDGPYDPGWVVYDKDGNVVAGPGTQIQMSSVLTGACLSAATKVLKQFVEGA